MITKTKMVDKQRGGLLRSTDQHHAIVNSKASYIPFFFGEFQSKQLIPGWQKPPISIKTKTFKTTIFWGMKVNFLASLVLASPKRLQNGHRGEWWFRILRGIRYSKTKSYEVEYKSGIMVNSTFSASLRGLITIASEITHQLKACLASQSVSHLKDGPTRRERHERRVLGV